MFFSSLELIGFKSFKREKFSFDQPISLFVGPNGCGKTNILDAIRWVLGEQNPYNLRVKSMSDLIFHGADNEKPFSMAEVSILLNNYNNTLPIESEEVKLTRRVFPLGESEYMINQKPCRLKDITSLLLDTGLSQNGYFLMNQEKIELILKSPEERLRLFEEASEVAGYRARKEEASSNLRKTMENITRIGDIIAELEKEAESLKYKASKARRYKRLKDELNIYKYHTLSSEYNEKKEELSFLKEEEEKIISEIIKKERIIKEKKNNFENLLERLKKEDEMLCKIKERKEKSKDEISRKEERLVFLSEAISSLKESEEGLSIKERSLRDELLQIRKERKSLLGREEETNLVSIKEKIQRLQEEEDRLKDELIDRLSRKARIEGERKEKEREISHLKNRILKLEEEEEGLNQERERIILRVKELTTKMEELKERIEREKNLIQKLKAKEDDLLKEENEITRTINELKEKKILLKNKLSSLSRLFLYQKAIEHLTKDGMVKETSILENLIEIDDKLAKAIEGFLGERLSGIVVDEKDIEDLIEKIKKLNLDRIFIILKKDIPQVSFLPPSHPSVIGRADTLVKVKDSGIKWLFSNLLIVKDLKTAIRFSQEGWKTVTLEGIKVEDGIIEAGERMPSREVTSLEKHLLELEEAITKLLEKDKEKKKEKDLIFKKIKETEGLLLKDETSLKGLSIEAAREKERINAISLRMARTEDEILLFKDRIGELSCEIAHPLDKESNDLIEKLENHLQELRIKIKDLMDEERKIELQRERLALLLKREEKQKLQIKEVVSERKAIIEKEKEKKKEGTFLKKELLQDKERFEKILEEEIKAIKTKEMISSSLLEEEKKIQEIEESINLLYKKREENKERIKENEVFSSFLKEKITSIIYEYGEAIKGMENRLDREKAERIEKELKSYSDIDLFSISSYDKIKERIDFYRKELLDLNKARDDLWQLIGELDEKAKKIFSETFKKIKDNFSLIFLRIFQGGTANLIMNNGRIEIEVELPGKKKKGLLLLSSGERTLISILLLFSLFMVKPAPFCFLDEIDASLDEANVQRFIELIKWLSKDTQFLIITHNKRTIGSADTIYGITMETPGVSKSLSLRLKNENKGGSI